MTNPEKKQYLRELLRSFNYIVIGLIGMLTAVYYPDALFSARVIFCIMFIAVASMLLEFLMRNFCDWLLSGLSYPTAAPVHKVKENHIPPCSPGYGWVSWGRGFHRIFHCSGCSRRGGRNDLREPGEPCFYCGAQVRLLGGAQWLEVDGVWQWMTPKEIEEIKTNSK